MFSDIIILAGGFGERLWPASKPDFPKQFMALDNGISFLQHSILRALALCPKGKIIIATRLGLETQIANQCNKLINNSIITNQQKQKILNDLIIISEPFAKHTTAPILLCSILLRKMEPKYKHSILMLTSDHIIEPVENFIHDVKKAYISATKNHVVTFGITPNEPSSAYGYIINAEEEENNQNVYKIKQFTEKPDQKTAMEYIKNGNCKWNSGLYAFDCDFFEAELQKCSKEVTDSFSDLYDSKLPKIKKIKNIKYIGPYKAMTDAYTKVPSIAIDKSLSEKTKNAYCVTASFNWDDVGSWDSFEKHCSQKTNNACAIQSKNCFVYSDIPVAICGVDDITVVIKNGKALVMKKGSSALVREAAKTITEK